jgi:hypothetical protein
MLHSVTKISVPDKGATMCVVPVQLMADIIRFNENQLHSYACKACQCYPVLPSDTVYALAIASAGNADVLATLISEVNHYTSR